MFAGNVRDEKPSGGTTTIDSGAPNLAPERAAGVRGEDASRRTSPTPAHDPLHDPIELHAECLVCGALLRRAFNEVLPGLELGPNGATMLLQRLREILAELQAAS